MAASKPDPRTPSMNFWEVPNHTAEEFKPKGGKYCISIFVINEGSRIRKQLESMTSVTREVDIIIADGGSTDGSLDPGFLERVGVRTLLVKQDSGRLSAQMRMAFAYALRQKYEGVIAMDGNGKDDPSAIRLFVQALDDGFDHVQGSRFVKGGRGINTPILRMMGIRFLHAPLISVSSGFHYTDTTNGFRAYSMRFLSDPRVAPFRKVFSGYELHYYLAIKAPLLGFKVKEIPVTRTYPSEGPMPTKIKSFRGNFKIIKTLVETCFHKFDPPAIEDRHQASS